ncbi:hypothetical protein DVU_1473 [Nitratidesulfovibrio vulgaris str. Hildenborough]|uniref:Uncharacterized protein n=1 Tax=Nitratidesulfovibrio vulgaris (strain ATCC 29579 / DSM 644 / CCUG 34227 / NCIMB 8303 / VKM B-1760 / Hildenborough) TaxID=882 RepID=Q72C11_NITV2|nr:hypothetical protein DVU_1473 [Nitratidesulfovibrio vulgaris str. Hildenborough]
MACRREASHPHILTHLSGLSPASPHTAIPLRLHLWRHSLKGDAFLLSRLSAWERWQQPQAHIGSHHLQPPC